MIIPTRHHTPWSKTLDNILHNGINENTISGNIMTDFLDHLAQFTELLLSYSIIKQNLKKYLPEI